MPKEKYDPPDPRRCYTIMSAEEASSGKKSHWAELEISGRVRSLSSSLWTLTHLTALHINDNNLTRIPPDIAKLPNLVYLNLSSNKLRSLPAELGNMVSLRELLLNNNLLRVLPYELGRLFQLQTLGLKGNPLSQDILNLYQELDGTRKLLNYMLDNLAVHPEQLPQRPWITLKERDQMLPTATFTVMCYNVLCDKYATRQLYGYCPSWALNWEYRKKGIMEEITSCDADIISLQEVETEQYYTMFLETLKERGYDGYFCPKSRAKLVSEQMDPVSVMTFLQVFNWFFKSLTGSFKSSTGSFKSSTGSFTSLTGSFKSLTGSFKSLTGSFKSSTGSFESLTGSFKSLPGSFKSLTGSFKSSTGSFKSLTGSFKSSTGFFKSSTGSFILLTSFQSDQNLQ